MDTKDIIVIGTSAGGLEALTEIVRGLPGDLPASIFVVRHISPTNESLLPSLLQRASQLKISQARDREPIQRGCVYVAPPDRHLVLDEGCIRLAEGPKENRSRPAIDPLFRSAALSFRGRVIGIVLTGQLDDGTSGLWDVKSCGGSTIVQDPIEAVHPSMPRSALKNVTIDHCVPLSEMAQLLVRLVKQPVASDGADPSNEELEIENKIALGDPEALHRVEQIGKLTSFRCPECRGTLWELRQGAHLRFRCGNGHANTGDNLIAQQDESIETYLQAALDATGENPTLFRHLSENARLHGDLLAADHFLFQTAENERRAHLIQQALTNREKPFAAEAREKWEPAISF